MPQWGDLEVRMSRLNYTNKVIEELDGVIRLGDGHIDGSSVVERFQQKSIQLIRKLLFESTKFVLPDGQDLLDHEFSMNEIESSWAHLIKLPFSITTFEFNKKIVIDNRGRGVALANADEKTVVLCMDLTSDNELVLEFLEHFSSHPEDDVDALFKNIDNSYREGFFFLVFNHSPDGDGFWWSSPIAYFYCVELNSEPVLSVSTERQEGNLAVRLFPVDLFPVLFSEMADTAVTPNNQPLFKGVTEENSSEKMNYFFDKIFDGADSAYALLKIIQSCCFLNCDNGGIETIEISEKVNRKRVKKGKTPFFEYKFLSLKVSNKPTNRSVVGEQDSEFPARGGVRTHLRRGHLRRLSSGKTVWVRATEVGVGSVRGVVDKEYIL